MLHNTARDDVFHQLAACRSQRNGPVVTRVCAVSFLEHWDYISPQPVIWYLAGVIWLLEDRCQNWSNNRSQALRIRGVIPSGPEALCIFRFSRSCCTPVVGMDTHGISGWADESGRRPCGRSVSWVKADSSCLFRVSAIAQGSVIILSSDFSWEMEEESVRLCLMNDQKRFIPWYSFESLSSVWSAFLCKTSMPF